MGKSIKHPLVIHQNVFLKTLEALAQPLDVSIRPLERRVHPLARDMILSKKNKKTFEFSLGL